ncbi:MAG TPA: hypothetical protein VGN34_15580 [Ktedonobacteraceae bacterium]|jgi:heme/copper-type cytochrome/quinol oxidase subunit 4
MQNMVTKSRSSPPIGIIVRSCIVGVRGLQLVSICILALATLLPGVSFPVYTWLAKFSTWGHVLVAITAIILAILSFWCVWGLWYLHSWALWAIVIVQSASILLSIIMFTRTPPQLRDIVSDILFPLFVIIIFFTNKRIRAALLHEERVCT